MTFIAAKAVFRVAIGFAACVVWSLGAAADAAGMAGVASHWAISPGGRNILAIWAGEAAAVTVAINVRAGAIAIAGRAAALRIITAGRRSTEGNLNGAVGMQLRPLACVTVAGAAAEGEGNGMPGVAATYISAAHTGMATITI